MISYHSSSNRAVNAWNNSNDTRATGAYAGRCNWCNCAANEQWMRWICAYYQQNASLMQQFPPHNHYIFEISQSFPTIGYLILLSLNQRLFSAFSLFLSLAVNVFHTLNSSCIFYCISQQSPHIHIQTDSNGWLCVPLFGVRYIREKNNNICW